jgi:hypothetical protein
MILIGRSYKVVIRYLSFERKILGCVSLRLVPWLHYEVAYSEDICALVAEQLGIYAGFCSCPLDLHQTVSAFSKNWQE